MSVEVLKALAHLDADSLNAAANAARRAGVPLADFLSQAVAKDGPEPEDGSGEDREARRAKLRTQRARAKLARRADSLADGDMDLSPFTTALDQLTARMDKAERRSMLALSGITEALGALASRIPSNQDYAEIQRAAMRAAERSDAFRRLSQRVDDVMARIQAVEDSPEADVYAVRRLEDAITRLTGHIQERQDDTAQSIAALGQTVQRLTQQLSTLQNSEAAPVDELREQLYGFGETLALVKQKTDKMVLRDELANFEGRFDGTFGKTLQASFDKALNEFTMRLEAAEGRSADAIQTIEADLGRTSDRLLSLEEQLGAIADGASCRSKNSSAPSPTGPPRRRAPRRSRPRACCPPSTSASPPSRPRSAANAPVRSTTCAGNSGN